ncbi:hypothetical protein VR45_18015 [Streptomyces sp. NRRL S-495]|nr:hypothetical protein VR45_18015 [Streptomyces sp. NRRL S-495]
MVASLRSYIALVISASQPKTQTDPGSTFEGIRSAGERSIARQLAQPKNGRLPDLDKFHVAKVSDFRLASLDPSGNREVLDDGKLTDVQALAMSHLEDAQRQSASEMAQHPEILHSETITKLNLARREQHVPAQP